eukprot:GHVQ01032314.1.p1 GENE.GHVQ01032314.1~~GHVQ01032314.1.p1  ORF type:complete len:104 (+),score=8.95 GHVQ01032314.1:72-383(+)
MQLLQPPCSLNRLSKTSVMCACSVDPGTGSVLGRVSCMNAKDTRQAIDAASDAFKTWKRTTAKQRHDLLMGWFRLMTEHKTELATLLSKENGKPVTEAMYVKE